MSIAREYMWMSFDDVVSDAAERLKDITNHEIPPKTLAAWASQGCREFARRSEVVRGVELRPLILGQGLYQLPIDCIRVREVAVLLPGYSGELTLPYLREDELLDGSSLPEGNPWGWYLSPDRTKLGFIYVPNVGGFDGYTTAAGNVGGTTLVCSGLSPSNDIYVGMTVRILDGGSVGQESVVTDYDAATNTITVSPAFTAQIISDTRFQIYPDTLRIEYVRAGNTYSVFPTTTYTLTTPLSNQYEGTLVTTLPARKPNFWEGREIRFTSENLLGERARILTSLYNGNTIVTVQPEFHSRPTGGVSTDHTFVMTDVPNIPDAFHSALVDYVIHLGLVRNGTPDPQHYAAFLAKVEEARITNQPVQGLEFEQVRLYGRGEYEWWEE